MVYITGDTHGEVERFKEEPLRRLKKGDTLFILGDFGFVWDGSREENARLEWLRSRQYTILFLDGTHENYDLLAKYPTEEKFGGRVQPLGGNLYHVCRGSILEVEGCRYLCFGGGESRDIEDREQGVNWWKAEMPTVEEYAYCEENVAACAGNVDYVLTHDAPSRFLDFTVLEKGETSQLHDFFDALVPKLSYKMWFFGRYHKDTQLSAKVRCVFCDAIPIGEKRHWWQRR